MTGIEITLLILGAIIFAASFIIPEMKKEPSKEQQKFSEAEIKKVIDREMEHVRDRVDEVVDETIDYTMEKTERSLSKISNEKIMAVNEYSDTVLAEINKNHKEVMFLYDMLNDKQTDLKNTVRKAEATKEEAAAAAAEAAIATAAVRQHEIINAAGEPERQFVMNTTDEPEPDMSRTVSRELRSAVQKEDEGFSRIEFEHIEKMENKRPEPIFNRFAEGLDEAAIPIPESVVVKEVPRTTRKGTAVKKQPVERVVERPVHTSGGVKNNNQLILEMHRDGKSNIEIAKELGLGLGEVKLVIDLFEGA